jgi:hypothetical protein
MAIPFLNHIDLTKSEIRNVSLHQTTTTAVGNEKFEGQIIYDTGTDSLKYYNGAAWINLDGAGDISKIDITAGDGLSGSVTTTSGDHTQTINLDAQLTTVTKITNPNLVIGRDADNDIDFATDNKIIFRVNGTDQINLINQQLLPVTDVTVDLGSTSKSYKNIYASKYYAATDSAYFFDPDGPYSAQKNSLVFGTRATLYNEYSEGARAQIKIKEGNAGWAGSSNMYSGLSGKLYIGNETRSTTNQTASTFILLNNTNSGTYSGADTKVLFALGRRNQGTVGTTNGFSDGTGSPKYMLHMMGDGHLKTGIWSGTSYIAGSGNMTVNNDLAVGGDVAITGDLVVTGTTTTVNVTTTTTANGVVFEGTTADGHDATLKSIVAGADVTYTLPNKTGTIAMLDDNSFRAVKVDTNNDGSADATLGAAEDLELIGGNNITLAESGGVVTINAGAATTVGLTSATQRSGTIELIAGSNVGISESGTTGHYTFSSTNTNTQLATAAALIDVSAMGANTVASFTHSLASKNLIVQLYQVTTGNVVFADIDHTSNNAISITFSNTPTEDIRVIVIDAKNGLTDKTVSYS